MATPGWKDYRDAFIRPFSISAPSRNLVTRTLPGIILTAIPFLNLLALGYLASLATHNASGRQDLPPFQEEWGRHLIDGAMLLVIGICYSLPFWALIVLMGIVAGGYDSSALLMGALTVSAAAFLVVSFLLPLAFLRYDREKRLSDAFAPAAVARMGKQPGYAAAWLACAIYLGIMMAAATAVNLWLIGHDRGSPLCSALLTSLATFLPSVTFFTLLGKAFRQEGRAAGKGQHL
ncbi:DUF4013 domain-containing protein [Candidatus Woesearchaeota archaeon]|nr:DUF4013 domain-containing protein [Candidatus Woesearchaeota archaeon]